MSCTAKLGRKDTHNLGDDMQNFLCKNAGILGHKYLAYLIIEAANYMNPIVLVKWGYYQGYLDFSTCSGYDG
jgi:hypothetical protein